MATRKFESDYSKVQKKNKSWTFCWITI